MPPTRFLSIMDRLIAYYDTLERVVEQAVTQEILDEAVTLADYNREQLMAGKRDDGSGITPEYTAFTVAQKKIKGDIYEWVTLKDDGDFHASITLRRVGNRFKFEASDSKSGQLERKYSPRASQGTGGIIGISEANLKEFSDYYLKPVARKAIKPPKNK